MTKVPQFTVVAQALCLRLQSATYFSGPRRPPISLAAIAIVLFVFGISGGGGNANASPEAKALLQEKACGGCHYIPGVEDAYGDAGPSLKGMKSRKRLVSGKLKNTPENLRAWIRNPKAIKPGTMMPPSAVTDEEIDIIIEYFKKI